MTLSVEIDAKTEAQLRADALEENISLEEMAARWMSACAMTDEEWEEAEDEMDNEAADAAIQNSEPAGWVYLDDVRPRPEQHRRAA